jgi:hypothetical protein
MYDLIRCTDKQYGSDLMARLAKRHFDAHPNCQFVEVYEHGGWRLGFRRDGSTWATANDQAVLEKPLPQPTGYSGVSTAYPEIT